MGILFFGNVPKNCFLFAFFLIIHFLTNFVYTSKILGGGGGGLKPPLPLPMLPAWLLFLSHGIMAGIQCNVFLFFFLFFLARRASRHPMDAHFWGKCIQNSPNLLKHLQGTCPLGAQLSISG